MACQKSTCSYTFKLTFSVKRHACKIVHIAKCVVTDIFYAFGDRHTCNIGTGHKSTFSYTDSSVLDGNDRLTAITTNDPSVNIIKRACIHHYFIAVRECLVAYLTYTVGDIYACNSGTRVKCGIFNSLKLAIICKGYALERGAVIKRLFANIFYSVRNAYACDGRIVERRISYADHDVSFRRFYGNYNSRIGTSSLTCHNAGSVTVA